MAGAGCGSWERQPPDSVSGHCWSRCRRRTLGPVIAKAKASLESAGLTVAHFDGVVPNPTTDSITAGAALAREHGADVVVGLGGGSSMDTAKSIAVEATHEGTCWDYVFGKTEPTDRTLPVIAVTTTSGTGSHVTQVAVATNTQLREKSYLCHPQLFPKVAIVDPGADAHGTSAGDRDDWVGRLHARV